MYIKQLILKKVVTSPRSNLMFLDFLHSFLRYHTT